MENADETTTRFMEWWRGNKERWNRKRRERYHRDREYRERVLEANRRSRRRQADQVVQEDR